MVRLLMNNLLFCGYSGWVGVAYLNFRKDFARNFLSLLMMSSFSSRKVLGSPRRIHIIDLSMSTHPTKNSFPPKFSCYICSPLKIENQAAQGPSRNTTGMSHILIAGQRLKLLNYTAHCKYCY